MRNWRFGTCLLPFLLLIPFQRAGAQQHNALLLAEQQAKRETATPLLLLLPSVIKQGYVLRNFIGSEAFGGFDSSATPEDSFDEIYYTAMSLAHGDVSNACLASVFGCLEHEYLPVNFFGSELRIPITSESHAEFAKRFSHLPTHLYHIAEDDRDKMQHFFASAWLKSWLGMDWLVDFAGELVEAGESVFLLGDARDPRDIHANQDGARFEPQAEANPDLPPSSALTPNP